MKPWGKKGSTGHSQCQKAAQKKFALFHCKKPEKNTA
jgi:hypothetical protein